MTVVGIDGCKQGWIAVELATDGSRTAPVAHHLGDIAEVADLAPDAEVIGIDIPIGLPDRERRRADVEAKLVLGPRSSSVFYTPPRAVLEAPSHAEATARSVELTGAGVSRQSFGLAAKILEVDGWLRSGAATCRVVEVHPEVSFTRMRGKRPPDASKKTWAGMVERRAALAKEGIDLDRVVGTATTLAAVDDMLDAGAVAWSARRLLAGKAVPLPDPPEHDADGLPMAIWA